MNLERIPDHNIFMMCKNINTNAFSSIPNGFHVRYCRKDELDLWKSFPFDTKELQIEYYDYMTEYFNQVYNEDFFNHCLFICDRNDQPVATAFVWKSYKKFSTVHWVKVLKDYEGYGLGRALLTEILKPLKKTDYPIYLHTQTTSYRAIKLYTDFGFSILTDNQIGHRKNEYQEALPYLKVLMPKKAFEKITYDKSDGELSKEAKKYTHDAF